MKPTVTCLIALWALCISSALPAAEDGPGITVTGMGEVMAKPDRLEIDLHTAGSAELTGDALVKYRDAMKRTMDAFEGLGLKQLKIEQRGLGVTNMGAANAAQAIRFGNAQPNVKAQIDIARSLRLSVTGVNKLDEEELTDLISKLLDTAKDSGASLSAGGAAAMMAQIYGQQLNSSLVTFVVEDVDEVRKQAYQDAFAQAKGRAQRLANLASASLGPVLSVEDSDVSGGDDDTNAQQKVMMMVYGGRYGVNAPQDARVKSDKYGPIAVRVSLRVRFGIGPGGKTDAKAEAKTDAKPDRTADAK